MAKANMEMVVEGVPESLQSAMDSAVAQFGADVVKAALVATVTKILNAESEPIRKAREVLAGLTARRGGRPIGSKNAAVPAVPVPETLPVA